MRGHRITYLPEELAWIEARKDWQRDRLHSAFCFMFQRDDVTKENLKSICVRKGWLTGRTGQFATGQMPHNKGKHLPVHRNSIATQFAKGHQPHNTRYLGHERTTKDGYIEVRVAETNPHTGADNRYVQKHRWLWEKLNGPVPAGMALKSLDGNRRNTDPSNWIAIPRALLPRLNGRFGRDFDRAAPEVKPLILATAQLELAAKKLRSQSETQEAQTREAKP